MIGDSSQEKQISSTLESRRPQMASIDENHANDEKIEVAKRGSPDAIGELLEAYRPWLIRLATSAIDSWLRPRLSASDVAQGSLVQAAITFSEFRGSTEREFKAWLRTLFANHLIDRQRELLAKRRDGRGMPVSEDDVTDYLTPSKIVVAEEDAGRLIEAIAQLEEELRAVVQLRYLHDLSFEEIASELGLSRHVVSRRWVRAIESLSIQLR
jgi:RNA polymerase sigma-70 factor (ECF subfamily)